MHEMPKEKTREQFQTPCMEIVSFEDVTIITESEECMDMTGNPV